MEFRKRNRQLVEFYKCAEELVRQANWHAGDFYAVTKNRNFKDATYAEFMCEYAYVVVLSGFNAKIAMKFWDEFLNVFGYFEDKEMVEKSVDVLVGTVEHSIFKNKLKMRAIKKAIELVSTFESFEDFKEWMLEGDVVENFKRLGHIGDVTKYHLAKNMGIDVVKPDRHLERLAQYFGYKTPHDMCVCVQRHVDTEWAERLNMIDYVLWWASAQFGTTDLERLYKEVVHRKSHC